jgi:hypothetical protein
MCPDITLCLNHNCSKKNTCYRYIAETSEYQSFFCPDEKDCEHYWKVKDV